MTGGRGGRSLGPVARGSPRCKRLREQGIEFATSVNTDTGGEFSSRVARPESGDDGTSRQGDTGLPGASAEFATRVSIGNTPSDPGSDSRPSGILLTPPAMVPAPVPIPAGVLMPTPLRAETVADRAGVSAAPGQAAILPFPVVQISGSGSMDQVPVPLVIRLLAREHGEPAVFPVRSTRGAAVTRGDRCSGPFQELGAGVCDL
jgi:hypothetical protein